MICLQAPEACSHDTQWEIFVCCSTFVLILQAIYIENKVGIR